GTEETDMNQMANTVLATIAVVLFAEMHDREQAFERAFSYWASYCAANCLHECLTIQSCWIGILYLLFVYARQ
ncbi:hypothetical protein OFO11_27265, partial [Escherichia coli]|nr:hypothetical protein [Escherichia coli]